MVSLELLEALDLVIWLRSTERAAAIAGTNQSTISRRSRAVLQTFGLRLLRQRASWHCAGDNTLLQLQRLVHQQARFRGRGPMRLHAPFWTRRRRHWRLSEGWCATPADPQFACDDPVGLLRDRVIDAALVTPTQLPAETSDLVLIELVHRPIELTLLATGPSSEVRDAFKRQRASGGLQMQLMAFLPHSCCQRSQHWFRTLFPQQQQAQGGRGVLSAADESLPIAFLTPEMREAQSLPVIVEPSIEPFPYVERLAVLAENASQPLLQGLLESLQLRSDLLLA
ncbi:MAG: hypothetical protein FJ077_03190 [Cyanobacteria bacterium K_DeepCast_35m_m2_023]|nr:hypothetical protein [Cyanobacteria bacterium K_DeepCast_35m_m2_023]